MKGQEDGVVVGVGCPLAEQLLPLISTEKVHAVANLKSTLSKVQIPRCRKGQSRRCPKSDAVKKEVKILRESDSIGRASQRPRTRLDECPTRSDRDQGQTRSRTRHRNRTRLVSHVLLTSLLSYWATLT